ncbi:MULTISPECIES: MMPL family transporter [unclassified Nocardia]|uniref:MMPL family transporter n=1 Tax=unclassified Nocardia TaxID=2637762 RepID=UPI001CE427F9|nr:MULTISPECIES: MMPL family transporter [unclassified Nocardia]
MSRTASHRMSSSRSGAARRRWFAVLVIVVWLAAGGLLSVLGGKLSAVVTTGSSNYLPAAADSKTVDKLNERFGEPQSAPALVVYQRDSGLTDADRTAVRTQTDRIGARFHDVLAGPVVGPVISADGKAAEVIVPFAGSDSAAAGHVPDLRGLLAADGGLAVHITGPAGGAVDLQHATGGIDVMLVLVTVAVILVILVAVYRSPLLPLLVLVVAGLALESAQGVLYLLVRHGVLALGSEVQGIFNVLVLGAATDYALLLVSRYREELRERDDRFEAMRVAWRRSLGPIAASGGTVAVGLLCLQFADLGLNRELGPAGAIGVLCALLAMLTLLPALLMLFGRAAFWPRRPVSGEVAAVGRWPGIAGFVDRYRRVLWIGTALMLAALAAGVFQLHANGIPENEMILGKHVDSVAGQQVLAGHFPAGSGSPVNIVVRQDRLDAVLTAVRGVEGVTAAAPYTGARQVPVVVDGLARADATLADAPDSKAALDTYYRLRAAVHQVPGADARLGGYTATLADFNDTAARDRAVMPLVLIVVCAITALLLRALVAPLLLLLTVVLSYLAAIGVSALVFQHVFGFSAVDATFPVHAFVFLVALGTDYNIFLMTRVREETMGSDTRTGMIRGLVVTGGVITSAGVVLAVTFAALAVIPLVLLVELAFTVAFGVLLDTFVVRTLLVPALTIDVGRAMWWPGRLWRRREQAAPVVAPQVRVGAEG